MRHGHMLGVEMLAALRLNRHILALCMTLMLYIMCLLVSGLAAARFWRRPQRAVVVQSRLPPTTCPPSTPSGIGPRIASCCQTRCVYLSFDVRGMWVRVGGGGGGGWKFMHAAARCG